MESGDVHVICDAANDVVMLEVRSQCADFGVRSSPSMSIDEHCLQALTSPATV